MAKPDSRTVLLQIPHCYRTEVAKEGNIRGIEEENRRGAERPMWAIWSGIGGRACDVRSYPLVLEHPAETERCVYDRAVEREVGGEDPPGFRERTGECKGVSFLVDGLLCEHGRLG